jgi:hypothetical protein
MDLHCRPGGKSALRGYEGEQMGCRWQVEGRSGSWRAGMVKGCRRGQASPTASRAGIYKHAGKQAWCDDVVRVGRRCQCYRYGLVEWGRKGIDSGFVRYGRFDEAKVRWSVGWGRNKHEVVYAKWLIRLFLSEGVRWLWIQYLNKF